MIVARADTENSEPKLLRASANRVILPYGIAGRRMVSMLVRPDVADFLDEVSRTSRLNQTRRDWNSAALIENHEAHEVHGDKNNIKFLNFVCSVYFVVLLFRSNLLWFDLELLIEQIPITKNSPLVGQKLSEAQLSSRFGINVLAIKMPGGKINTKPGAETVLQADYEIIAIGTSNELLALKRLAEK
jgi:voltage-gated potassium channel